MPFRRKPTQEPAPEWTQTTANLPAANSDGVRTWGTLQAAYAPDTAQQRANAPIKRLKCLALRWEPGQPMPDVCNREHDHPGDHATKAHDGGPVETWAGEDEEELSA